MSEYISANRDRATAALLALAEDENEDAFIRGDAASTVLTDEQEHRRMDEEGRLRQLEERLDDLEEEAERQAEEIAKSKKPVEVKK